MNKKAIIFTTIGCLATTGVITAITIPLVIKNTSSNAPINKPVSHDDKYLLTQKKVDDLFKNEWKDKTDIIASDFENFKSIDITAFDNIPNKLNTVEIPSYMKIKYKNAHDPIHWPNVLNILVFESDGEKNLFIKNNILFSSDGYAVCALSIANRNIESELLFPTSSEIDNKFFIICDNFYNENIFSKITIIKFNNTRLNWIGESAFLNCNKLENNLTLSLDGGASIAAKAFYNTNVINLNITFDSDKDLLQTIGHETFSKCSSLKTVNIKSNFNSDFKKSTLHIGTKCFFDCFNLTKVDINCRKLALHEAAFALSSENDNNNDFALNIETGNLFSLKDIIYGNFNKKFLLRIWINQNINNYEKETIILPYFFGSSSKFADKNPVFLNNFENENNYFNVIGGLLKIYQR